MAKKNNIIADGAKLTGGEWRDLRRDYICGSDCPIIMGTSPYSSIQELYCQKAKLEKRFSYEPKDDVKFRWAFGHHMESFVADWFEECFDAQYKGMFERHFEEPIERVKLINDTNMYRHPVHKFMAANIDRIIEITFACGDTIRGIFECKTTTSYVLRSGWCSGVPSHYVWQGRHYMSVMDMDFTVFACAADNDASNFCVHIVKRDMQEESKLIEAERSFWENHVLKLQMPEISENCGKLTEDYIAKMAQYITGNNKAGDVIDFSPKLIDQFGRYFELSKEISAYKSVIKQAEEEQEVIKAKLAQIIGEADGGTLSYNGYTYNVERVEGVSTTFNKKQLIIDRPALAARYTKETPKVSYTVKCSKIIDESSEQAS